MVGISTPHPQRIDTIARMRLQARTTLFSAMQEVGRRIALQLDRTVKSLKDNNHGVRFLFHEQIVSHCVYSILPMCSGVRSNTP